MLTKPEIRDIVRLDNHVLRNLKITHGYYELSQGMRRIVGAKNVNWCTFATHASRTAGYAIRHEVMPQAFTRALVRMAGYPEPAAFQSDCLSRPNGPDSGCRDNPISETLARISFNVSEGNRKVFAELAWPFSHMITTFAGDWRYDPIKLQDFLDDLFRYGPMELAGQEYLREAFTAFYQARFETGHKRKAELIYRANLLVALHEQTRLQPDIAQALAAPIDTLLDDEQLPVLAGRSLNSAGVLLRHRLANESKKLVAAMVTHSAMFILMPWGEMSLSRNVRAPAGSGNFPPDLATIEEARLRQLIRQWDRSLDTLSGSAAENWASLADRMSFAVDLFRSHQQNTQLFDAPFTLQQADAIHAGRVPAGKL
ncbi:MAG: hypothetical protein L0332_32845 [Chloroflexi bacterium]|nr:hypothetical protein [Chloroflexota bacterium]MCI0575743.1 hypothetical protein [Chloroflexota bacterium]MCI0646793.1 hypothetical protein [Chloroflexota bacterium]MCI0731492.1 hypothetical protein [Chloroflexota bacterium]